MSPDRNEPSFKMLVGRLCNAGVSVRVPQQTFQTDAKTIQRWGRALRSRNVQELIRVLEGRRSSRKLSPEIKAYARVRWPDLVSQGLYGIGKRLRLEIQSVFGVRLWQETLRPLMGELKRESAASASPRRLEATTAEGLPQGSPKATENQALSMEAWEKPCGCAVGDGAAGWLSAASAPHHWHGARRHQRPGACSTRRQRSTLEAAPGPAQ